MAKAIASLTVLSLIIALSVLVMMEGWGLEPQSWWWIIGGGVFGHYVLFVIAERISKS